MQLDSSDIKFMHQRMQDGLQVPEDPETAGRMRDMLNWLRTRVADSGFTKAYTLSPEGILDAYREGDVDFESAIDKLRNAFEAEAELKAQRSKNIAVPR